MTAPPAPDRPPYEDRVLARPAVWGWMGFDVAAQPFFTVVLTFVFGPYFTATLAPDPATGQAVWSAAATVAGIVVALVSPALGAIADRAGPRKPWIAGLAIVQVTALAALWFAAPGSPLVFAAVAIVAAQVSAEFAIVFNDAMLPRLVAGSAIGRVSNVAWGMGYAGGMIFLVAVLALLAGDTETGRTLVGLTPLFGLDPAAGEGARATGPLAALWYLVFLVPLFAFTPDRPRGAPIRTAARQGLGDLVATYRAVRERRALFQFFLARMLYQDGVNALLVLGGAFAAGMFGWSLTESGAFGILLNLAAILGCWVAGRVDARFGPKPVIVAAVVGLTLACLGIVSTAPGFTLFGALTFAAPPSDPAGLFATPAERAYLVYGLAIGLAFGPVQASSRSWLARSITPDEAGRYFGFYAFTGRATSFLTTGAVAGLTALSSGYAEPQTAARIGMAAILVFLLAGLAILLATPSPVDTRRR